MIYRVYRRMMRKFARFVLGFDNCPSDCRKNYGEEIKLAVSAFLLCAGTIVLFFALVVSCCKGRWSFV